MNASIGVEDDIPTLRIGGELDAISAPRLRPVMDELLAGRWQRVVVDISSLRLIDSCGVGALVALFRKLKAAGRKMSLQGAKEQPLFILRLMKLDRVLTDEGNTKSAPGQTNPRLCELRAS